MTVTDDEPTPGESAPLQAVDDALVANAIAARTVNEAIRDGRLDDGAPARLICECGTLGCHALVELAPRDYESVRAHPRRFLIVPGHEAAHDEPVASADGFVIVAKHGAAAMRAERTDPRAAVRAPASYRVPTLSFVFPATAEAVPRARHWVDEFAAARAGGAELHGRIVLAFTEAFTNAVLHAYEAARPGQVEVAADVEDGTLEIVVIDQGRGLTPSKGDGLGAGLAIIARSTDAFGIRERTPTGTEVWLRFTLPQLEPAGSVIAPA
jgi:anti-sigma regulatory factor (Ser/Thr protein kinase)